MKFKITQIFVEVELEFDFFLYWVFLEIYIGNFDLTLM